MVRLAVVAAAVTCVLACNGKKPKSPAPPSAYDAAVATPQGDPAECDALAEQVAALYRTDLADPIDGEVEDATSMILHDCRKQPAKLAACIRAAKSVAELERDCVIPLDGAGSVEGAMFGRAAKR